MVLSLLSLAFIFVGLAASFPLQRLDDRAMALNPVIAENFPDPAIIQDKDGTWYAFSTNNNGKKVPAASAQLQVVPGLFPPTTYSHN